MRGGKKWHYRGYGILMCIERVYSLPMAFYNIRLACGLGKASYASLSKEPSARFDVKLSVSEDV